MSSAAVEFVTGLDEFTDPLGATEVFVVGEFVAAGISEPTVPGPFDEAAGCDAWLAFAGGKVVCCALTPIRNTSNTAVTMSASCLIISLISS